MKYFITVLVIILIGFGAYQLTQKSSDEVVDIQQEEVADDTKTETEPAEQTEETEKYPNGVIGQSTLGNDITAYTYGTGDTEILLVGGIHGGYEWNTVTLAYKMKSYLEANPSLIPENLKVTVIPVLNPDGLEKVVGTAGEFALSAVPSAEATIEGRFNANEVDLNRNFDCDWSATGTWQNKTVNTGTGPFSEAESATLRDYVAANEPAAAVIFYSAAGGVYASSCGGAVSTETKALLNTYAKASGYPANEVFDDYKITGDAADWLAKIGVPTVSVLLTTHNDVEFDRNLLGVKAVLQSYSN